jgi:hypothetical protein
MRSILVLMVLVLAPLVACGGGTSAKDQYCNDVSNLSSSVKNFTSSVGNLNLQQTQSAFDTVKTDWNKVQQSAKAVSTQGTQGGTASALSTSFNQLSSAVQSLGQGGGGNLSSSLVQIGSAASQFGSALSQVKQDYSCKN